LQLDGKIHKSRHHKQKYLISL